MTKLAARIAILLLIAVLGGTIWVVMTARATGRFAACSGTSVAGGSRAIGGPFTLIDQTGATVTDRDVLTKPALIYFGYTFCPDVCPVDNARNAEATDILEERGIDAVPVFISIDPKRDTPEVMAAYVANIHPKMIGLTGSEAQVRAVAQAYKTYFKAQEGPDDSYLVDHSTFTYLVLPESGFADVFRRDQTADEIADRVACFVEAS